MHRQLTPDRGSSVSRSSNSARRYLFGLALAGLPLAIVSASKGTDLYWIQYHGQPGVDCYEMKVLHADQPEATPQSLSQFCSNSAFADPNPVYGALAVEGDYVYLRSDYVGTQPYWRIPRAGGAAEPTSLTPSIYQPEASRILAQLYTGTIDAAGVYSYWGEPSDGVISRGDAHGNDRVPLIMTGYAASALFDLALDESGGKMYWVESGGSIRVRRANLDGTGTEAVGTDLFADDFPVDIAVDSSAGKVYLMADEFGAIYRMNLDGDGFETLVSGAGILFSMAIAPTAVPEPNTVVLALAAVFSFVGARRLRNSYSPRS